MPCLHSSDKPKLQHALQGPIAPGEKRYDPLTVVILVEVVKLLIWLIAISPTMNWRSSLDQITTCQPSSFSMGMGHRHAAVPAMLQVLAKSCQAFGAYYLPLLPFLVLSQIKLLMTPIFASLLLRQNIQSRQWVYMMLMAGGIVLVESAAMTPEPGLQEEHEPYNHISGTIAMVLAGACVSLSSIFMEKSLKDVGDIWARNAQLAFYSCAASLAGYLWQSEPGFTGFFEGYCQLTWLFIILQAIGGYLVAWCLRSTNSIAKNCAQCLGFLIATSSSLLMSDTSVSYLVR